MIALTVLLLLAPSQGPPGTAHGASGLADYERRRLTLEAVFGTGEGSPATADALALDAQVQSDEDVPSWYKAEISALADSFLTVAELEPAERSALFEALAVQPSTDGGPQAVIAALEEAAVAVSFTLGADHPEASQREFLLSNLSGQMGRWDDALEYARSALDRACQLEGERHMQVALRRMWLGWILRRVGEPVEAERQLLEARGTLRRLDVRRHGVFVEPRLHLTNYLGMLHADQGRFDEAEILLRDYTSQARLLLGERSVPYLGGLNNLALLLARRGDSVGAVAVQSECVATSLAVFDPKSPRLAQVWYNLGTYCIVAGRPREAREALERSLAITKRSGVQLELLVLARTRMAYLAQARGDIAGAARIAEDAMLDAASMSPLAPNDRLQLLECFLWSQTHVGEIEKARAAQQEFASLAGSHGNQGWTSRALLYDAILLDKEGQDDAARVGYLAALDALEVSKSIPIAYAAMWFAEFERKLDQPEAALRLMQRAVSSYEIDRSALTTGFDRSRFAISPYPRLALLEFERGDVAGALGALEAWRSRSLYELLAGDVARSEARSVLGRRLAAATAQLEVLRSAGSEPIPGDVAARVGALEAQVLELGARLAVDSVHDVPAPRTIEQMQSALAEGEAFVGWFEFTWGDGPRVYGWVLGREGPPRAARLELTESSAHFRSLPELVERLAALSRELASEARSAFAPAADALTPQLSALGRDLLDPLVERGWLDGIEHLVVASDALGGFPVEALRVDRQWVGERWTLSHAPSCTVHALLRERRRAAPSGGRALVVGDPPFRAAASPPASTRPLSRMPARALVLADLARLPHSGTEAASVASLFEDATLLAGTDARESTLQELARDGELGRYSVIHLATHALVDNEEPARSGIVLSQLDLPDAVTAALRGETVEDGFVSIPEIIAGWQLDADLVTISTCRSALGATIRGEGYVGLTTGFLRAGARSVIASLWDVQDEPTMIFMRAFYSHWTSSGGARSKALAMQAARRTVREFERDGERPFAHPSFWSAFVLIGDPD